MLRSRLDEELERNREWGVGDVAVQVAGFSERKVNKDV